MTLAAVFIQARKCPREFWVMIVLKILFSYSYFTLSTVLVVYLSNDHNFSDMSAAGMYSAWAIFMSLYQFAAGPVIDYLQIRRSLIFGSLMTTIGMFMLAFTFNNVILVGIALFFFIPLGSAYLLTVVDIGGKRYSEGISNAIYIVFSIFYSGSNVGALLAGVTNEFLRDQFGPKGLKYVERHATAERMTIMAGAIMTSVAGLIAALIINEAPLQTQADLDATNAHMPGTVPPPLSSPASAGRTSRCWPFWRAITWLKADVIPVLKNVYFQKLIMFNASLIGVLTLFRHLDSTFPKVILRAFGPGAHYAALYSINPFLLIFITPFIGAYVARFDIYNVMIVGTMVSAFSMFIMAFEMTTLSVIAWSFIFTLGEAIYSPQTRIYVMAVAPEGREGMYASLVYAPNLLSKIIVGPMSGYLLETYCPQHGPYDQCHNVWINIGFVGVMTPFLLMVLKRFIHTDAVSVRINARKEERFASVE
jgi:MFS family permease